MEGWMKIGVFTLFLLCIIASTATAQRYWPYNSLAYPIQRGTHVGQGFVVGETDAVVSGSIAIGSNDSTKKAIVLDASNAAIIGEGTNSVSGSLQFGTNKVTLVYVDSTENTIAANYEAPCSGCILVGKYNGANEVWVSCDDGTEWKRTGEATIAPASIEVTDLNPAIAGAGLTINGAAINVDEAGAFTKGSTYLPNVVQSVKYDVQRSISTSNTNRVNIVGLSVNITPKSVSSKIRVTATVYGCNGSSNYAVPLFLQRNGIDICQPTADGSKLRAIAILEDDDNTVRGIPNATIDFLDSPETTSQLTYKLQMSAATATEMNINMNPNEADTDAYARCVSVITVEEIYQ
jgi:hypothetical protein